MFAPDTGLRWVEFSVWIRALGDPWGVDVVDMRVGVWGGTHLGLLCLSLEIHLNHGNKDNKRELFIADNL